MSRPISAVTVYCSSSTSVDQLFFDAARRMGHAIARAGWKLVYGGTYIGPMAALADGCREAGGKVIGIIPQLMIDKRIEDKNCDELIVTGGMRQRKELMEQRGDAFVTLPGGVGTFEEFFEILVGRQLRYHDKPIVLLNIQGFYDPLIEMLHDGVKRGFIRDKLWALMHICATPDDAVAYLISARAVPPSSAAPGVESSALE